MRMKKKPKHWNEARAMGQSNSAQSRLSQTSLLPGDFTDLIASVPVEVLEEIFLNLPPEQVVCVCSLVCREWKDVVDSESLWRQRCRREGFKLCDNKQLPKDWQLFYFLRKKRHNLLKNSRADERLDSWQILENGGDKWKIEDVEQPLPDNTVQKFFVTSYQTCKKSQLIDLAKEGYKPSFMDVFQPDIVISDWYAPRCDCGSQYEICVELLDQRKKEIQTFVPDCVYFEQWNDQKWNQMTHVFKNYGPGARFIRFTHGGKDTQFWAGWYGIRVTNSSVEICHPLDTELTLKPSSRVPS